MIPSVPCKNCSDRKVGCHSDCEKYLKYKAEMERQRILRIEQKEEIDFHICEKGRLKMTYDKWVKQNIGKGIDYDGAYGVQCVDLAKHYIKNVLGITPQSIGNAIEYYNKRKTSEYLTKNFKWIDNTAEFIPKKGDLCVFTSRSGHGHISVATGKGTTSYFYSYDQNFPKAKHEPMTLIKHSYNSFLGVLRPKNQANIGAEKKKPTSSVKTVYFKPYKGKSDSLVDTLEAVGAKSDFAYRKKIAKKNKITNYKGTSEQNGKLLALLKKGKLVKP